MRGIGATTSPIAIFADLVALAKASFALIVIVPGGKATEKLIDRPVIDALGPEGTLINIARGSVVDDDALIAALQEGRLGAAGLDVFVNEPQVPAPSLTMENVVLEPHQGSATVETRRAMGDLMLANLAAHFAGETLLSPLCLVLLGTRLAAEQEADDDRKAHSLKQRIVERRLA